MSEEYESLNSKIPDFASALVNRISQKTTTTAIANNSSTFDPYQAMLKKKNDDVSPIDPAQVQQWPDEDMKNLQDYCQKMGIVGFNSGRMHPLLALRMLKQQVGDNFENVPLEERVPAGYEKINSSRTKNPDYPFTRDISKKQILHG
jgi:hypothetical protein